MEAWRRNLSRLLWVEYLFYLVSGSYVDIYMNYEVERVFCLALCSLFSFLSVNSTTTTTTTTTTMCEFLCDLLQ